MKEICVGIDNYVEYAPVLIPTMNRINHLKKCIMSLQKNPYAQYTEIIISVDYPPEEKYIQGYREVCEYLDAGIGGFKQVTVIKQSTNLGAYFNYIYLKNYVQEKYTRFIFSEDDNEFSPNFLEFINKGLTIFEEDNKVIAICSNGISEIEGYSGTIALTQNFSAQGYGTWIHKDNMLEKEIDRPYIEKLSLNKDFVKRMYKQDVSVFYSFKSAILADQKLYQLPERKIPIIDMIKKVYMMDKELYAVAPIIQTSRNYGYDGSGVNCPATKDNNCDVVISKSMDFVYQFPENIPIHMFVKKLKLWDWIQIIGCKAKLLLYRMYKRKHGV